MLQSAKTHMCSNCIVSRLHSTFGLIRSICLSGNSRDHEEVIIAKDYVVFWQQTAIYLL